MQEEKKKYIIPQNYTSFFMLDSFIKPVNIIEAMAATFIVSKILGAIPFVLNVKAGVMFIVCSICFLIFLFGYNEESIMTYLVGYFKYKFTCGVRRIKVPDGTAEENAERKLEESNYDKLVKRIRSGMH